MVEPRGPIVPVIGGSLVPIITRILRKHPRQIIHDLVYVFVLFVHRAKFPGNLIPAEQPLRRWFLARGLGERVDLGVADRGTAGRDRSRAAASAFL